MEISRLSHVDGITFTVKFERNEYDSIAEFSKLIEEIRTNKGYQLLRTSEWNVALTNPGPKKIQVIKLIRELSGRISDYRVNHGLPLGDKANYVPDSYLTLAGSLGIPSLRDAKDIVDRAATTDVTIFKTSSIEEAHKVQSWFQSEGATVRIDNWYVTQEEIDEAKTQLKQIITDLTKGEKNESRQLH